MSKMLELKNISFQVEDGNESTYGTEKEILKDINMIIEKDKFVVITGPNGSGKSTLARIIMGMETPTSGRIFLDGQDITDFPISQRAKLGIGFAFQQPVRFKGLTVKELLRLSVGKELDTPQLCEYLSEVGLCALDYINREINASLSGGEIKRIEIAMLLARGAKLSIFDEPEAGIDLWSFHNLIKVFEHVRDHSNGSVLIISHQERILEIADTIVVLSNGEVTAQGPGSEVLPEILQGTDKCEFYRKEQSK